MKFINGLIAQVILFFAALIPFGLLYFAVKSLDLAPSKSQIGSVFFAFVLSMVFVGIGVQWIKPDEELEIYKNF